MTVDTGIFGNGSNLEERYISDYEKLATFVKHCKGLGLKIVLTSGSYDIFHEGHAKYLEMARSFGDILIVGVDSDEKVKKRKGPNRPVVPEDERIRILSHTRHADVITIKKLSDPKWLLIKTVCPDVLVISKTTGHEDGYIESMKEFCGEVELLEPQSTTSTTAKVRLLHIGGAGEFAKQLEPMILKMIQQKLEEGVSKIVLEEITPEISSLISKVLKKI